MGYKSPKWYDYITWIPIVCGIFWIGVFIMFIANLINRKNK